MLYWITGICLQAKKISHQTNIFVSLIVVRAAVAEGKEEKPKKPETRARKCVSKIISP